MMEYFRIEEKALNSALKCHWTSISLEALENSIEYLGYAKRVRYIGRLPVTKELIFRGEVFYYHGGFLGWLRRMYLKSLNVLRRTFKH